MRKPFGHEQRAAVLRRQFDPKPAPLRRRVRPQVDDDVEDRPRGASHQLVLAVGRRLKVQAAQCALARIERHAALGHLGRQPARGELSGIVAPREEAAFVLDPSHLDRVGARQRRFGEDHGSTLHRGHRDDEPAAPGPDAVELQQDLAPADSTAAPARSPACACINSSGETTGICVPGSNFDCLCGFRSATMEISSRSHAAKIEQRVALGGGAVGRHRLAFALGLREELAQRAPAHLDPLGKTASMHRGRPIRPPLPAPAALRSRALSCRSARRAVGGKNAQRAAVRRQLLDVVNPQAVAPEHLFDGVEREVRIVLVVDRVELDLLDQFEEMGKFDGRRAGGLQQRSDAGDEVVQPRHMGQHVVADDQIGAPAFRSPALSPGSRRKISPRSAHRFFPRRRQPCPKGRCRGQGCRAPRSSSAGSRRCSPAPRPDSAGRAQSG